METSFVERLAAARIGATFNQYSGSKLRCDRLAAYLAGRSGARLLLVAEAPGYRGTRISGIPLTSERQLTGTGPAEATATIVQTVLAELGIESDVLLWSCRRTPAPRARTGRRPGWRSKRARPSSPSCRTGGGRSRSAGWRRRASVGRMSAIPHVAARRRFGRGWPRHSGRVGLWTAFRSAGTPSYSQRR